MLEFINYLFEVESDRMGNLMQKEETERTQTIDERARELTQVYPLADQSLDTLRFAGCVLLAEFEKEGTNIWDSYDNAIVVIPGEIFNDLKELINNVYCASRDSKNQALKDKAAKWMDAVKAVV